MMNELDEDGSGAIDFKEWYEYMKKNKKSDEYLDLF